MHVTYIFPSGAFIDNIRFEFLRRAMKFVPKFNIAHGPSIFWHKGKVFVQGVTELVECVRTKVP